MKRSSVGTAAVPLDKKDMKRHLLQRRKCVVSKHISEQMCNTSAVYWVRETLRSEL
jgi:hypothetical protein